MPTSISLGYYLHKNLALVMVALTVNNGEVNLERVASILRVFLNALAG